MSEDNFEDKFAHVLFIMHALLSKLTSKTHLTSILTDLDLCAFFISDLYS